MTTKLHYWLKEIAIMVAIGSAVLLFFHWMDDQKQRGDGGALPVGMVAPDFHLRDVRRGVPVSLEGSRGTPVALIFWATYCGPCRSELPGLERIYREAEGRYELIGVSPEAAGLLREFLTERALTFPTLSDPRGEIHRAYGVSSIPMTVIIDGRGRIVHDFTGPADPEILQERLLGLAAGS